jgi:imidazolonepropionase-like amidohydrolase
MVFGTDAGIYPHGMAGIQLAYMVEYGMTPMEAIQAATSVAARYLGWEDRVGAIEAGRYGDLVAVPGDPLADISVLENVSAVVKGGEVIKAPATAAAP